MIEEIPEEMNKSKHSTDKAGQQKFDDQPGSKSHKAWNRRAKSSKKHSNQLKSQQVALEEKMAASARQAFPDIELYVEPTRAASGNPSSSHQSSHLRLNVGGKLFDISRSSLTQIQGSKLAYIFSGKWDEILPHDNDGRIFMDFDSSWLEPIFDHLQNLTVADTSGHLPGLIIERQPFGVTQLSNYLDLESLFEDGSIITPDQWTTIKSWIHYLKPSQSKPKLLFRGSRDGFTAAAFHAMCDGVPDTVTIVRDTNGNVFGGYADVPWSITGEYVTTNRSFVFSLSVGERANIQFRQMKANRDRFQTYQDSSCIATFGIGGDLKICNLCNEKDSNYTSLDICGSTTNSGSNYLMDYKITYFQVAEIEVYKFSSSVPINATKAQTRRRNNNASNLSRSNSEESLSRLLASHHSINDLVNDIDRYFHDLESVEEPVDNQLPFLRSYIDRMMQVKCGVESESSDEEIIRPSDRIINFNVGGTIFSVSVGILSQIPESMLWSGYASGRWQAENHELDADGNIFLDHNPSDFSMLITLLRLKSMVSPKEFYQLSQTLLAFDAARMNNFKRFLDYFQIDPFLIGMPWLDSSIAMSTLEVSSLCQWMNTTSAELSLVFRGSRDGFTAAAFHATCDGVPDTVTIVRDTKGSVFGGYADVPWSSSHQRTSSSKSFLFSLSIRGAVNPQKCRLNEHNNEIALDNNPNCMAAFGTSGLDMNFTFRGGIDDRDLFIADRCNKNTKSSSRLGHAYTSPDGTYYYLTGGSREFQVSEIEVWCIIA